VIFNNVLQMPDIEQSMSDILGIMINWILLCIYNFPEFLASPLQTSCPRLLNPLFKGLKKHNSVQSLSWPNTSSASFRTQWFHHEIHFVYADMAWGLSGGMQELGGGSSGLYCLLKQDSQYNHWKCGIVKIRRGADKSLAFERNLVSARQCCSSQGGLYAPEIGRSSLWSSETHGLLTWFGPFGLLPLS
jgi:hypothetical protein